MKADTKRKMKASLSRRMSDEASGRQCPKCKRKFAIQTKQDGDWVTKWCRWCDYEDGRFVE